MAYSQHPLHNFLNDRVPEGLQVELTDTQAIRFAYYFKMKFDIANVQTILNIIDASETQKEFFDAINFKTTEKILVRQSLWVNSIVTYSRLFNDKGRDRANVRHIRLDKNQCYKNVSNEILKFHDKIIEIRNLYISHGVENNQEHIIPYFFIKGIDHSGEIYGKFGVNSINPISYSPTDLKMFREMINMLLTFIENKLNDITDILFETYKDVTAQTWFDLAIKQEKL